jgi:hypothetical protein
VSQVGVQDLLGNPLLNGVDLRLDPAAVERYGRDLDAMDPVVVFDTPEGLLLADGYHRAAAARRAGRSTVAAEVRIGTRQDALRYAVEVAAAQQGITQTAALEAIMRRAGREQPSAG